MGTRCRRRKRPPSPSTPPFSWAPLLAGLAEERVEPVVATQGDEPLVLDAVAALQDPRDRRLEVVVAHPTGQPTKVGEPEHMTLEEGLLGLGGERSVERPTRRAQPHREQPQLGQRAFQPHPQLGEVDLGLRTGVMDLRHRGGRDSTAKLPAQPSHILAHGRLAQLRAVLVTQPLPDPMRSVPLLLRQRLVGRHPRLDQRLPRIQNRAATHRHLALRRHRAHQGLAHSAPMHPMLAGQRPDAHAFKAGIATDNLEQLHPRSHPFSPAPAVSATTERRGRSVGGGATSGDQSGPGWGQISVSNPSTGWNIASAPTSCCAGWRCC
jgi:hypothetical protein